MEAKGEGGMLCCVTRVLLERWLDGLFRSFAAAVTGKVWTQICMAGV